MATNLQKTDPEQRPSAVVTPAQGRSRIRVWGVVFASLIGLSLGLGPLPFYTIGILAPELSHAFGWSFAAIMGSIAVQSVVTVVASPLFGRVIDRYGARRVALTSLALFGLTYMSFGLTTGALWTFYVQWGLMTFLGAGTLSATWTRVVNGWFDKNRGLALGIASTGTGLTGVVIKPLATLLISYVGWEMTFVIIGALPIIIGIPIVAALFIEEPDQSAPSAVSPREEYGPELRDALSQPKFWLMCCAFALIGFAITAPTPNLENILKTMKFTPTSIAEVTGVFGLAVVLGRVIGGWLLDRLWAPACAMMVFLLPALGCWILGQDSLSAGAAIFAIGAIGFGAGFEFDLLAYLTNRYFGLKSYGTLYGIAYASTTGVGGLGPVVYGAAFDTTGSYEQILGIGAFVLITGATLLLLLGRYPEWNPPGNDI